MGQGVVIGKKKNDCIAVVGFRQSTYTDKDKMLRKVNHCVGLSRYVLVYIAQWV